MGLLAVGCATGGLPQEAVAHNTTGAELLAEGRLDDAEARFHLALEYQPRFSEPRANLGLVALQRDDLRSAERHLEDALRLNDEFAEAWSNMGIVRERLGRDEEARAAYERALSINPGLVGARRNVARLLVRVGEFADARAHLMRLVQLVSDDSAAEGLLAYCEVRLDRPEEGERRANEVLARDEDDAVALVVRGIARATRGEHASAIADLERAQRDETVGADARVRLAALYLVTERVDDAKRLVTRLLRDTPDDAATHLIAGWLALAEGDSLDAREHADRALVLSPELPSAQALLARIDR